MESKEGRYYYCHLQSGATTTGAGYDREISVGEKCRGRFKAIDWVCSFVQVCSLLVACCLGLRYHWHNIYGGFDDQFHYILLTSIPLYQ